jgi:hypothetical protein
MTTAVRASAAPFRPYPPTRRGRSGLVALRPGEPEGTDDGR